MDFFLNPDDKEIEFYISEKLVPVVIKRMVTRAPIQKIKNKKAVVPIATLEKIMVDIFADENLFHFYQGSEMVNIYEKIYISFNYTTYYFICIFNGKRYDNSWRSLLYG